MGDILSRWPVVVTLAVTPADLDGNGRLETPAIDRLFAEGREAYFALCPSTDPSRLSVGKLDLRPGPGVADEAGVTVAVNVVEVFSASFVMEARIRPVIKGDTAGAARARLSVEGGVSPAMRDEFIALAHGASRLH